MVNLEECLDSFRKEGLSVSNITEDEGGKIKKGKGR